MKKLLKIWGPSMIIALCAMLQIALGMRENIRGNDGMQLISGGLFVACFLIFTIPTAFDEQHW